MKEENEMLLMRIDEKKKIYRHTLLFAIKEQKKENIL